MILRYLSGLENVNNIFKLHHRIGGLSELEEYSWGCAFLYY